MNAIKESKTLQKYVRRVGLAFFIKYIEDIILKFDYLKISFNKNIYVEEILKREPNLSHNGIKLRISYMMNIIEMNYVPQTLAMATISTRLDSKIKIRAEEILKKLTEQ